jgi:hypothetical protein
MKLLSPYAVEGVFKSLSYQDLISAIGRLRVAGWKVMKFKYCVEENSDDDSTLGYRDGYDERLDRIKESEIS